MGTPTWMTSKNYPAVANWPYGELYYNTRYVYAANEFTPQQTMRGKAALYGYLYATGLPPLPPPPSPPAVFDINISANLEEGVEVSGGGNNIVEGTNITVTATAGTGYSFINWTENGIEISTDASYTFTVAQSRSLVANFAKANVLKDEGAKGAYPSPVHIYPVPANETVTITDLPDGTHYTIYNATGTKITTGTINEQTINISQLTPGVYLIVANNHAIRFVKQ